MPQKGLIAVDLAQVYETSDGKKLITTLAWGDEVTVKEVTSKHVKIGLPSYRELADGSIETADRDGFIRPPQSSGVKPAKVTAAKKDLQVLKIDFVDVQQGDASVIETPKGKVVLMDGGDNQLFARYLASRYRGSRPSSPKEIDAMVVSHGDADHFAGLTEIFLSETNKTSAKRLFIHPKRVYHNGLVKRPEKLPGGKIRKEDQFLGETVMAGDKLIITGLETNLLNVPDEEMNKPFRDWKEALKHWRKRGSIEFRRLARGDDDAFDFLNEEGIGVEVLGPLITKAGSASGLLFLGNPPKGPRVGHESLSLESKEFKGKSASHTINGHSIFLRLTFGRAHFLFSGDLNDQSERALTREHNEGRLSLRSEVFKAPHHGSADFSGAFLEAVSPIVSIVSSGDESARKEYIHPRATLVGALGRYSRVDEPLVFVTELVAFFQEEGWTIPEQHVLDSSGKLVLKNGEPKIDPKSKTRGRFYAFSRSAFGIVKIRTDGNRLLVYTNSAKADLKEAYAYTFDDSGRVTPAAVNGV